MNEVILLTYNPQACYKTCYQKYVIQRCFCGDSQYPFYGEAFDHINVSACDPSIETQGKVGGTKLEIRA